MGRLLFIYRTISLTKFLLIAGVNLNTFIPLTNQTTV